MIAVQVSIQVPQPMHAELSENLAVLHERRNKIVHHLLDDFDLSTISGCDEASRHLEALHRELDARLPGVLSFLDEVSRIHGEIALQLADAVRRSALPDDMNDR